MQWRFRTGLVATIFVLSCAMVAISLTSFLSARDVAEDLARQVLSLSTARIDDDARRLLAVASAEVSLDRALFTNGRVDASDKEAVLGFFIDEIRAHPELSSLSWTSDATSEVLQVDQRRDGTLDALDQGMAPIAVGATVVGLALALALGVSLGKALRRLAVESARIGQFELAPSALVDTPILEFRQLSAHIEDAKRSLRSFRKFVPAEIVRRLVQSGNEAARGGQRQLVTVHFSDIAGFTSFSESLSPEELVELLNDYLTIVTEPIAASGGTLDKYIGDAVMAFWNAPTAAPDHAFSACAAALENRRRVAERGAAWRARGWPAIACRAGIHTGEAVVGNIGSNLRLDFTAIGDTVNLASRLEGLGKVYGVDILISASTLALVEGRVVARPLDRVAVKGREGSVLVYELVGLAGEVAEADLARVDRHRRALDAYFAQAWEEALALLDGTDEAARVLRERISTLRAEPPGSAWDGVHRMKTK